MFNKYICFYKLGVNFLSVQEIANLVWNHYSSSNVEPFSQLILKPMEYGSTLWNQTRLDTNWFCDVEPNHNVDTDWFHNVEPKQTCSTLWNQTRLWKHIGSTMWNHYLDSESQSIHIPSTHYSMDWLSGLGKQFHNVEPLSGWENGSTMWNQWVHT